MLLNPSWNMATKKGLFFVEEAKPFIHYTQISLSTNKEDPMASLV